MVKLNWQFMETETQTSQAKPSKSIYDVGYGSIFFKNFLSGFARSLGSVIVYVLLLVLVYYLFTIYIAPRLQNLIPNMFQLLIPNIPNTSSSQSQSKQNGFTITQDQYQQALEYLKQNPPANIMLTPQPQSP